MQFNMRKTEHEALVKRIKKIIQTDPRTSRILAERFGVTTHTILGIAQEMGVVLPTSDDVTDTDRRRLKGSWNPRWGGRGGNK